MYLFHAYLFENPISEDGNVVTNVQGFASEHLAAARQELIRQKRLGNGGVHSLPSLKKKSCGRLESF